jgi:hypothetical protein
MWGGQSTGGSQNVFLPFVTSQNNVLQVGPTRLYKTPSAAAQAAKDGMVIQIDTGLYSGDVATWRQNNLTIRGVGGMAHLEAAGNNAGGKAIWVIQGANTVIESVEFSGATVPDQNGAGIRQEGANLTLRHCYFHNNENGILAGDNPASEIWIESTEFAYNGFGTGYTHNLYINHVKKFTLIASYSHHAKIGHLVKSRAYENYILYNHIMDEADGTASYNVDLPDGGISYLIGNLIQQGPKNDNPTIVAYNEEHSENSSQQYFYAANNTLVNDAANGTFFWLKGSPVSKVVNNLLVGPGTADNGAITQTNNLPMDGSFLVDRAHFDYHLQANAPAINTGINPGVSDFSVILAPVSEYVHPTSLEPRTAHGAMDVGAYEYPES